MITKIDDATKVSGTHLQGYVETTYAKLVDTFGEPNLEGDEHKVDVEWLLETPAGVATVYNWKDGKKYLGEDGLDVADIKEWHIGGHSVDVVEHIIGAIEQSKLWK